VTSPGHDEDRAILERVDTDLDRHVAMIADEFREGFRAVDAIGRPAVTVYGSARIVEQDPAYERAREIGRRLAEAARRRADCRSASTSSCRTSRAPTPTSTASSPSITSTRARRCS
jgi:hypothetical protein